VGNSLLRLPLPRGSCCCSNIWVHSIAPKGARWVQMLSGARAAEQLSRVAWWGAQMEPWAASSRATITSASAEGRDVKTQHEVRTQ